MPKRIPDETREKIIRLYDHGSGLSPAEIARQTGVSYPSVYGLTRAKERGFASRTEYQQHLAKERGFASRTEYQQHLAKERGFASRTEYQQHLAKERRQQPLNQELSTLVKQRLAELGQTRKWLAEQLGITEGAVSRYINGKTTPRKSLQESLFNALELPYRTLDDLLEDSDIE